MRTPGLGKRLEAIDRLARPIFWLPMILSLAVAVWVAWLTYLVSASPVPAKNDPDSPGPDLPLWSPDHAFLGDHSPVWAWTLLGLCALAALTYAIPRRRRMESVWIVVGIMTGALVIVLGVATYLPCLGESESPLSLPGWVLSLFVGAYEFDGPAKSCAMRFAPGFSLARSLGVAFTVGAGAGVILRLLEEQISRFRVRLSDELDVVIGLNDASLPLVRALVAQNEQARARASWIDRRAGWLDGAAGEVRKRWASGDPAAVSVTNQPGWRRWWLTGLRPGDVFHLRPPKRLTVVLDGNGINPLLGEARQSGALVLIGDPTDSEVLRTVAIVERFRTRRVSFHRMYAVSVDQGLNLKIEEDLQDLFARLTVKDRRDQALPRLFVRMDDERRAQQWRASRTQSVGAGALAKRAEEIRLIRDAVTVDGLAAIEVVEHLVAPAEWLPGQDWPTHVALVGDGRLSYACLDELAWQLWTRLEIAVRRTDPACPERAADVATLARSHIVEVSLYGETAGARLKEWQRIRGLWDAEPISLQMFNVTAHHTVSDDALSKYLGQHDGARVVFIDPTPAFEEMGSRLARTCTTTASGKARVITIQPDNVRVPPGPASDEAVRVTMGLVSRSVQDGDLPPTDSMTRHAHQQHRAYHREWSEAVVNAGSRPSEEKQTGVPWSQLPEFFREENVRQYWQILSWFNQTGRPWVWARSGELPILTPGAQLIEMAAHAEYARWVVTRKKLGWWPAADSCRHDALRLHPDLRGWDHVDKLFNINLARMIIERMVATGLVPSHLDVAIVDSDAVDAAIANDLALAADQDRESPTMQEVGSG